MPKVSFRDKFSGSAYIVDGDTIRVGGKAIRLHGLDAPEIDQMAQGIDGKWHDQGEFMKGELTRLIDGCPVQVEVISRDKYRRTVGIVTCDGTDVNSWLVENGHAISAYGEKYRHAERRARRAGAGYGATGYPFIRANGEKSQRTRESCDVSISAFHLQYRLR